MTFGHGTQARRQRQRFLGRALRFTLTVAVVALVGVYAYRMGLERSGKTVASLDHSLAELTRQNAELTSTTQEMAKKLDTAEARARELERNYRRDVPSGPAEELVGLVRKKLETGVDPSRLAFVIDAAGNTRDCEEKAVTRRFLVQTPLYQGPNSSVSFANNTITIQAEGEGAQDSAGNPEAWFDPAKPVTIRFTLVGGESKAIAGKLPLHHSIVADGAEQRFSIIAGERGFVNVVGDRCRYP